MDFQSHRPEDAESVAQSGLTRILAGHCSSGLVPVFEDLAVMAVTLTKCLVFFPAFLQPKPMAHAHRPSTSSNKNELLTYVATTSSQPYSYYRAERLPVSTCSHFHSELEHRLPATYSLRQISSLLNDLKCATHTNQCPHRVSLTAT